MITLSVTKQQLYQLLYPTIQVTGHQSDYLLYNLLKITKIFVQLMIQCSISGFTRPIPTSLGI
uniref:Uncharacterized protein n=1 Tax=Arundo donax TaxID=35708 RepID=A0A0A9FBS4_ARUDO